MNDIRLSTPEQVQRLARRMLRSVEAGVPLSVRIERYRKRRSVDQNRRYWAIVSHIASAMPAHMDGVWYAPEVWHEYFKRHFLGVEPGPFGPVPRSSRKLNTVDFAGYTDQIEAWAAEQGLHEDYTGEAVL